MNKNREVWYSIVGFLGNISAGYCEKKQLLKIVYFAKARTPTNPQTSSRLMAFIVYSKNTTTDIITKAAASALVIMS